MGNRHRTCNASLDTSRFLPFGNPTKYALSSGWSANTRPISQTFPSGDCWYTRVSPTSLTRLRLALDTVTSRGALSAGERKYWTTHSFPLTFINFPIPSWFSEDSTKGLLDERNGDKVNSKHCSGCRRYCYGCRDPLRSESVTREICPPAYHRGPEWKAELTPMPKMKTSNIFDDAESRTSLLGSFC